MTELDLATLVTMTGAAVSAHVVARLAEQGFDGVKASHGYVVQRLLVGEPTVGELAVALDMTQQGASKQVLDLERLGYAERVAVPGDQRARAVRLTERGHAMVAATRRVRDELETQVARRAGRTATDEARVVLTTLVDVLGLTGAVADRQVPPR